MPNHADNFLRHPPDFSLVIGGPIFQLLRQCHLSDDALHLVKQRIIVISLFCWLPLLMLSTLEGKVLTGITVPFLLDFEVHVRFLVVIPLLIGAELVVHRRMQFLVKQFLERDLIPKGAIARFESAVASALRLRNSAIAEVLLFIFVYLVGITIIWRNYTALSAPTWYATPSDGGSTLSISGMWFGYLSLPLFQFLLCRWYFRLFIWIRFLWQVSRIDLTLVPTHPDRVGGLGFLSVTVYAFIPLLIAHGALLAGYLGDRIYHLGAKLPDFILLVVVFVIFLMFWVLGPLLVFAPRLAEAKRIGLREYGMLSERYVREFDAKWLRGGAGSDERLVGNADIQSLADLSNSFEIVRTMRVIVFTKETIAQFALATVAPVAPLVLTMMSVEDILKKVLGILF